MKRETLEGMVVMRTCTLTDYKLWHWDLEKEKQPFGNPTVNYYII